MVERIWVGGVLSNDETDHFYKLVKYYPFSDFWKLPVTVAWWTDFIVLKMKKTPNFRMPAD